MTKDSCHSVQEFIVQGSDQPPAVLSHLESCTDCRDFELVSRSVHQLAPQLEAPKLPPLVERRVILAAINGRVSSPRRRYGIRARYAAMAVMAVGVLLSIGLLFFMADGGDESSSDTVSAVAQNTPLSSNNIAETMVSTPDDKLETISEYSVQFDEEHVPLVLRSSKVWGAPKTGLTVEDTSGSCSLIRLHYGRIVADVKPGDVHCRFVVRTPSAYIEVRGTVFSAEVADSGEETVRVLEGAVAVKTVGKDKEARLLIQNQQLRIGDTSPETASKEALNADLALTHSGDIGADELVAIKKRRIQRTSGLRSSQSRESLLKEAKRYRRSRNFNAARTMYLKLIAQYPGSNSAANAMVALAQMEQGVLNDRSSALKRYREYLKKYPIGPLAEEAWIGQVRILSAMKKHRSVVQTASAYLVQRPTGARISEVLRRRGDAYYGLGRCVDSTRDYKKVVAKWPNSKEARYALLGIRRCGDVSK